MDFARRFIYGPLKLKPSLEKGWPQILMGIALLFFIILACFAYWEIRSLKHSEEIAKWLLIGMEKTASFREKQGMAVQEIRVADPHYMEKHIEGYIPLQQEIEALEGLLSDSNLSRCGVWAQRHKFLKGEENRLHFRAEKRGSNKSFQEVELQQLQPVQLGLHDVEQLLIRIEGRGAGSYLPPSGRPDLTIIDGQLRGLDQEGLYEIELKLLKREEGKT